MAPERVTALNDTPIDRAGRYVLYWMQRSQRAEFNPALEHAISCANRLELPVLVGFGLFEDYPEANERHFAFLLEGLADVSRALEARGIALAVRRARPDEACLALSAEAALVVCDRGYLRHEVEWRDNVAGATGRKVVQVEGDAVVPADVASGKREYAARTLRPKIHRALERFTGELTARPVHHARDPGLASEIDPSDPDGTLGVLGVDRSVARSPRFRGGAGEARRQLEHFLRHGLPGYRDARNDPADPQCSNLSPYLHFGQISPVEVVRKTLAAESAAAGDCDAFLEELVVRRELAINYVRFEPDYDRYHALPGWARETLARHRDDHREHVYTRRELERAETHDRYWNAAMIEMVRTGYMHNYMRMYWGKRILEWCNTPEHAFRTALALNNRYFLDGRDPSSYAGVAWIFGLHDRPWTERPIFGTVRYMNARGLERKFDIERYVRWAEALEG